MVVLILNIVIDVHAFCEVNIRLLHHIAQQTWRESLIEGLGLLFRFQVLRGYFIHATLLDGSRTILVSTDIDTLGIVFANRLDVRILIAAEWSGGGVGCK